MSPGVINYVKNLPEAAEDHPQKVFDDASRQWQERFSDINKMNGSENPYSLHRELAEQMITNVLIVRQNSKLEATLDKINEFESRWKNITCLDTTDWSNPVPSFINQLWNMIQLSKVITKGALMRDEFRGSHYKPEFDLKQPDDFQPETYLEFEKQKADGNLNESAFDQQHLAYMKRFAENNEKWLKTTIAEYKNGTSGSEGGPEISYEDVDTSLITPRPRKYN